MRRVPAVPYLVRAALTLPFYAMSSACLWVIVWITPEVENDRA